jgi:hypothetical protein
MTSRSHALAVLTVAATVLCSVSAFAIPRTVRVVVTTATVRLPHAAGVPNVPVVEEHHFGLDRNAAHVSATTRQRPLPGGLRIAVRSRRLPFRSRPVPIGHDTQNHRLGDQVFWGGPEQLHNSGTYLVTYLNGEIFAQNREPNTETLYAHGNDGSVTPLFTIAETPSLRGARVVTNHVSDRLYLQVQHAGAPLQYFELEAGGRRGARVPASRVTQTVFAGHDLPYWHSNLTRPEPGN